MGSEFRSSKDRDDNGAMEESGTKLADIDRLDAALGVEVGEAVAGVVTESVEVLEMVWVYVGAVRGDM